MREKRRGTKGLLRYIEDNPIKFTPYIGANTQTLLNAIEEWSVMPDKDRVLWDIQRKEHKLIYNIPLKK